MVVRGRPMKYSELIRALELDESYSVATVVERAETLGFLDKEEFRAARETRDDVRVKIRMAINRLASQHLPKKEDALLVEVGQQPQRAWCGWRWKDAIPKYYFDERELRAIEEAKQAFLRKKRKYGFPMKLGWLGNRLPRKAWASLALVFGIGLFAVGFMAALYPEGVRVFREKGPRAALAYFSTAEKYKRKDPVAAFGRAWSRYTLGEFKAAEVGCQNLISRKDTPRVTVGNSYFLLGKIATATGRFDLARSHFGAAIEIFEGLGRGANLFKTYCALADLAMEAGDLAEADFFISEAEASNESANMNPGELYQLKAELFFRLEDYERAIVFSYHQYEAFKSVNNVNEKADALVGLGFYLILDGQLDEGFQKTMEAQILINETSGQNKMYYTFLNLLMIRRCEGRGYGALESALVSHIQKNEDQRLQGLLDFVLATECGPMGPEETGEGNEDPPPNVE